MPIFQFLTLSFFESKASSLVLAGFLLGFSLGCIRELSPREDCYERNRCEHIEGDCYLKNLLIYKTLSDSSVPQNSDLWILLQTCSGLRGLCRKNCESTTLF